MNSSARANGEMYARSERYNPGEAGLMHAATTRNGMLASANAF
jgi:hypothetical protein